MEFKRSCKLLNYTEALSFMEQRVNDVILGHKSELIWFLEHYPVITGGSSSKKSDLLNENALPIYYSGRGGKFTYHGPGQRIVYFIIDLHKRSINNKPDLKSYIYNLEQIIINSLNYFDIIACRIADKTGVWIKKGSDFDKIAAIGIRVRKWIAYHGIAININPNLSHFKYIIPCGIEKHGITSLHKIGVKCTKNEFDTILKQEIIKIFNI